MACHLIATLTTTGHGPVLQQTNAYHEKADSMIWNAKAPKCAHRYVCPLGGLSEGFASLADQRLTRRIFRDEAIICGLVRRLFLDFSTAT